MNRRAWLWLAVAVLVALVQLELVPAVPRDREAPRGMGAVLLQFRPLVAGLMLGDLIVRAQAQDFSALDRARRILDLYPQPPGQRDFVAYYLAFTVSLGEGDPERSKLWIRAAVALYEEGLYLAGDAILHSGLALIYREKSFAFDAPVNPRDEAARHFVCAAELAREATYAEYAVASIVALAQHGTAEDRAHAADYARRLLRSQAFETLAPEHEKELRDSLAPVFH